MTPTNGLCAAIVVGADFVEVCTAGDLRVHLLSGGAWTRVTRDHAYANDPFENEIPDLDPAVAASLATS